MKKYLQQVNNKEISVNKLARKIGMPEPTLRRKIRL